MRTSGIDTIHKAIEKTEVFEGIPVPMNRHSHILTLEAIEKKIEEALIETIILMKKRFDEAHGVPQPGSDLDQAGLRDGADIVREYIRYTEARLALEHLIYMIFETDLPISLHTYSCIEDSGMGLNMDPILWEKVRPISI